MVRGSLSGGPRWVMGLRVDGVAAALVLTKSLAFVQVVYGKRCGTLLYRCLMNWCVDVSIVGAFATSLLWVVTGGWVDGCSSGAVCGAIPVGQAWY